MMCKHCMRSQSDNASLYVIQSINYIYKDISEYDFSINLSLCVERLNLTFQ